MRGMNRVMLVGNIGKDPELRELSDGAVVTKVSLATTEIYRAKLGNSISDTQWHTVVFWRSLAQLAAKYLRKGSLVLVEGKIQNRKYEDAQGALKFTTEILANRLLMLDRPAAGKDQKPDDQGMEDFLPF